jgi:hypothetical protein
LRGLYELNPIQSTSNFRQKKKVTIPESTQCHVVIVL